MGLLVPSDTFRRVRDVALDCSVPPWVNQIGFRMCMLGYLFGRLEGMAETSVGRDGDDKM